MTEVKIDSSIMEVERRAINSLLADKARLFLEVRGGAPLGLVITYVHEGGFNLFSPDGEVKLLKDNRRQIEIYPPRGYLKGEKMIERTLLVVGMGIAGFCWDNLRPVKRRYFAQQLVEYGDMSPIEDIALRRQGLEPVRHTFCQIATYMMCCPEKANDWAIQAINGCLASSKIQRG